MVGRKGEYLFKRKGSANWHIKFVYPAPEGQRYGKRVEFSLGTPDRTLAEIAAAEEIKAHKVMLHLMRMKDRGGMTPVEGWRFEPGRMHDTPDGKVLATRETLTFLDGSGEIIRVEPNRIEQRVQLRFTRDEAADIDALIGRTPAPKPSPPPKKAVDKDFEMLEEFLGLKPRNKFYEREARDTWADFKRFVEGRTMAECTRTDGRAYVKHLRETRKLKTATIVKVINYLSAPLNHAAEHGGSNTNPFFKVVDQVKDAQKRLPLSEADMALCRTVMLPKLGRNEMLLWMMCATTGMRHSECFAATEEFEENGVRYIMIGEKTDTSYRRVPLPNALLPYLPGRITGPLFDDTVKNVSKNLLRALRRVGITDPRKVVYSLRHRAHDRLRAAGCPLDVQHEIVGHENESAHAGYGHGYPVATLKQWVEQIGY